MRSISFVLTNDNFFTSETFNAGIVTASTGQLGLQFNSLNLPRDKSLRFDFDTVDWDWCQGDTFVILDNAGRVTQHWTLKVPVMHPGECPECHGTHNCAICSGSGVVRNSGYGGHDRCTRCSGTGVCQTCYVPVRATGTNIHGSNAAVDDSAMRNSLQRKAAALRERIQELEADVQKAERDIFMYQLKGMDVSSRSAYMSVVQYKTQLNIRLIDLRSKLSDIERQL